MAHAVTVEPPLRIGGIANGCHILVPTSCVPYSGHYHATRARLPSCSPGQYYVLVPKHSITEYVLVFPIMTPDRLIATSSKSISFTARGSCYHGTMLFTHIFDAFSPVFDEIYQRTSFSSWTS